VLLHAGGQADAVLRHLVSTLSRRSFVKAGGALIVAFALPVRARAAGGPPDPGEVDSYLTVHADGTVGVRSGRVEVGQGTTTGLLVLVAEELEVDLARLSFVRHDTDVTPDTGGTLGSSSIALAGPRLRSAAATAKQTLLGLAAVRLGVPA